MTSRRAFGLPRIGSCAAAMAASLLLVPVAAGAVVVLFPCVLLALLTAPVALTGLSTAARSLRDASAFPRGASPSLVELLPDLGAGRFGGLGRASIPPSLGSR